MGALEVQQMVKRLGGRAVVDGVSFRVEEGEFFVLLGASGSGKSTLLRLISGLETPDAGRVVVDGKDITTAPARERNVGMVFQDYGLYPNMNVYQNIAYGLEARSVPRSEIEKRVPEAAATVGLGDKLNRSIVDLSGGEQQRVALARAMAKDASLYLFDEPLSNLDPKLRHQARRDILNLHRKKQKPSLYITHDQTEAIAMADQIGILANGKLQQVGTADELLHSPANMYVAGFLGSPPMNLIRGTVRRNGLGYEVQSDDATISLPQRFSDLLQRYSKPTIVVGIRPDALAPAGAPGSEFEDPAAISGVIADVEPLIGETVLTLKLGPSTSLNALFPDDNLVEYEPGAQLEMLLDRRRLCLFDPDTEQALAL